MAPTDVATANVRSSLRATEARAALALVLAQDPDLVGLQEWSLRRLPLLRETGRCVTVPGLPRRVRPGGPPADGYLWCAPLVGGCAVGARAARYDLLGVRLHALSRPGPADRQPGRRTLEPGRTATVAHYRDRLGDRTVALVDFHLVSGVEAGGRYRADRPLLVARHRHEVRALERLVGEQLARGYAVHATGDANRDGLHLPGLTSAWAGRPTEPGTLGPRRRVDDVHGPGPATAVLRVPTASDHVAIVVRRPDRPT